MAEFNALQNAFGGEFTFCLYKKIIHRCMFFENYTITFYNNIY